MQAVGGEALTRTGPWHRGGARWLLALLALSVVAGDLVSKELTLAHLAGEEPVRLLGGAVYLTHATNSGAAFNLGSSFTWLFTLFAFAVIGTIGWLARRLRSRVWAVALGLVAGGATGNLLDRLFREPGPFVGEVVDTISVFAPDGSVWPIFNIADSALVIGVALGVWLELTGRARDSDARAGGARVGRGRVGRRAGTRPAVELSAPAPGQSVGEDRSVP